MYIRFRERGYSHRQLRKTKQKIAGRKCSDLFQTKTRVKTGRGFTE